ncbi:hypothetical protein L249_6340 [Ophiocordyceps polyrhachis-furcata BCC 54312]|uniref:Uncharacterized protein n=1 Tax=Ophiocordyceps polyrhachis-furcata BCC 54312 TaxID=1330021 RepID=A0A367L1V5_9HYPO|nr:hypothetical protein L249_6340 [Ophiocordyceps polyrhachis-furcata BCC 54312]
MPAFSQQALNINIVLLFLAVADETTNHSMRRGIANWAEPSVPSSASEHSACLDAPLPAKPGIYRLASPQTSIQTQRLTRELKVPFLRTSHVQLERLLQVVPQASHVAVSRRPSAAHFPKSLTRFPRPLFVDDLFWPRAVASASTSFRFFFFSPTFVTWSRSSQVQVFQQLGILKFGAKNGLDRPALTEPVEHSPVVRQYSPRGKFDSYPRTLIPRSSQGNQRSLALHAYTVSATAASRDATAQRSLLLAQAQESCVQGHAVEA